MKRDIKLTMRVTAEEKELLEECAGRLGMSQTEVVIKGIQIMKGLIEKHRKQKEGVG